MKHFSLGQEAFSTMSLPKDWCQTNITL